MKTYDSDLNSRIELISNNLSWLQEAVVGWRTYYTGAVNLELTVYWLLQFGEFNSTRYALDLIKHLNFIDTNRLVALLLRAWNTLPEQIRQEIIIAPIGSSYDSSSIVGYSFAKNLDLSEAELTVRWGDIRKYGLDGNSPPLALIDDNLTSGTQLIRFFSEMFSEFSEAREHFLDPLLPIQIEALKKTTIYIVVAIELGNGRDAVITSLRAMGFNIEISSGAKELTPWLEFGGPIWATEQDSSLMKSALSLIGESILNDKGWSSKKVKDRVFGYGNLQRLTVFEHNVPKSLITAFWKYGKVGDKFWIPLFPERKEWTQYESCIRNLNPELKFISDLVCSGKYGKATPVCSGYFNLNGDPSFSIKAIMPSSETVNKVCEFVCRKILPIKHMPLRKEETGLAALQARNFLAPKNEEITTYNMKIDRYNNIFIPRFKDKIVKTVQRGTAFVQLPLRIYNDGTCPASDVVLKIELPETIEFCDQLPPLPQMPDPPREPTGMPMYSMQDIINNRSTPLTESSNTDLRLVRDRGKIYINIYFGKILQRTFRDRDLKYLLIPVGEKLSLPFEIIFNEASRVVEGAFQIQSELSTKFTLQHFILKEWFNDDITDLVEFCTNT